MADAPDEVRELVSLRKDTLSHAYELMKVSDPKKRRRLADQVARGELTLVKLRDKIEGRRSRPVRPEADAELIGDDPQDADPVEPAASIDDGDQPAWASPPTARVDLTDDSLVNAKHSLADALDELVGVLRSPDAVRSIPDVDRANLAKYLTIAKLRLENAIAIVRSTKIAYAYGLNFDELWETGDVLGSGSVQPRPVDVDGIEVRPWFTPEHGEALAHRIAKRIGQAKRRIRIASPVLSSAPILGTLAEVCSDGRVDVAGVVDDTQVDDVVYQWRLNGNSAWKVPLLRQILEKAKFTGKPSTKWAADTVHDYMHAKITVADDVSFVGSFNLSHSGEKNAENVLEIRDASIADQLAAFVDEIRAIYPAVTFPEDKTQAPAASPLL